MTDVDVAVIGAGVVGLACAARLAQAGRSVVVIERHPQVGQETSSRNSGVIHAGLYYPTDSLKASLCVEGRQRLYARCARHEVPHARCGKLLVATDEAELEKLEEIRRRGLDNGAGELRMLTSDEVRHLEPHVRAMGGLLSPETGIVDVHGLMDSYRADAREHGAEFSFVTHVTALESSDRGWTVVTQNDEGERFDIEAGRVVNAGGLHADRIAAMAGLDVEKLGLAQHYCKGDYFALASRLRNIATRLIYPVPVQAGLGIHITLDLGGKVLAGPDTEYVSEIEYDVDPSKAAKFGEALRRYLPDIRDEDLSPDYAGVRPKLQAPGEPSRDFHVEDAAAHGAAGLVNLIGIESPGVTASEAIARRVEDLIRG